MKKLVILCALSLALLGNGFFPGAAAWGEEDEAAAIPAPAGAPNLIGTYTGNGTFVMNATGIPTVFGACTFTMYIGKQQGGLFRGSIKVVVSGQPSSAVFTGTIDSNNKIYITQDNYARAEGAYIASTPPKITLHWGAPLYPLNSGIVTLVKQ